MIMANPLPEVSVILPAHNEADNLPALVDEILAAQRSCQRRFEILVIDDASSDATPVVLEKMMARIPNLFCWRMKQNVGQSGALSAGFDVARGDIIVTLDADRQNDPADIPQLLELLDDHDMAIGYRAKRKDTFSKRIISKTANFVRNRLTGETVRDTGCGLKAFRHYVARKMHRFNGMHRFFPTLAKMHGFTVAETPVNHRPRAAGKSHYNIFNRSIRPIMDLLAICWLQRRALRYDHQPLIHKEIRRVSA